MHQISRAAAKPLLHAHSHNDYHRKRPLLDALDHHFTSVEADVHLIDGKLKIGHNVEEASSGETLEELYLDPLRHIAEENGGQIFDDGTPLTLLVDVKSESQETYKALRTSLASYSDILTEYEDGIIQKDPVRVILSGNVAREKIEKEDHRYLAIDGRLGDLENGSDDTLVPLISQNWSEHFFWHGFVPMPQSERQKLERMVSEAHDEGKEIRFWGTPDREDVWREEMRAGVDVINADDLPRLERFLTKGE